MLKIKIKIFHYMRDVKNTILLNWFAKFMRMFPWLSDQLKITDHSQNTKTVIKCKLILEGGCNDYGISASMITVSTPPVYYPSILSGWMRIENIMKLSNNYQSSLIRLTNIKILNDVLILSMTIGFSCVYNIHYCQSDLRTKWQMYTKSW